MPLCILLQIITRIWLNVLFYFYWRMSTLQYFSLVFDLLYGHKWEITLQNVFSFWYLQINCVKKWQAYSNRFRREFKDIFWKSFIKIDWLKNNCYGWIRWWRWRKKASYWVQKWKRNKIINSTLGSAISHIWNGRCSNCYKGHYSTIMILN